MSNIFLSYCHQDEKWLKRILKHLNIIGRECDVKIWEDRSISAGSDWLHEIKKAMNECSIAILLVSVHFLNSKFIIEDEVPTLLARKEKEGIKVIPLILSPCPWSKVSWLKILQLRPKDGKPLSNFPNSKIDEIISEFAIEVSTLVDSLNEKLLPDKNNTLSEIEMAIISKCDSQYRIAKREWDHTKKTDEYVSDIKNNIERDYSPGSVFFRAIDIQIDHYLLPILKQRITIESDIRKQYSATISDRRFSEIYDSLIQIIKEEWSYIVDSAYHDACRHCIKHTGSLREYKEDELKKFRDKQYNVEPDGLHKLLHDHLNTIRADLLLEAHK